MLHENTTEFCSQFVSGAKSFANARYECLAVAWSILKFKKYVYGVHFVVQSDHQPLSILKSSDSTSGRQTTEVVAEPSTVFVPLEYLRGADKVRADFLSRHFKFSSSLDPRYQNSHGLQITGGHMLQGVPPRIHQRSNKFRSVLHIYYGSIIYLV